MRIRVIIPVVPIKSRKISHEELENRKKTYGLHPETVLEFATIERGPSSIESRYDEALAIPEIIKLVRKAEADGVDACVINCFGDPGVRTCREIVKMPVVGPCESSLHIAASLCDKFSVITVLKNVIGLIIENAKVYGVYEKLASIRAIDIPVLELYKNEEKTMQALLTEGEKAIEEDKAEVLVLGCTGMEGLAKRLSRELEIPVIDPLPAAVKFAETLVALGLSHSKLAFPPPPEKVRY